MVYIFLVGGDLVYTSDHSKFTTLLKSPAYKYMGFIKNDNGTCTHGGPHVDSAK